MADLSALTDHQLERAEEACEYLLELCEEHKTINREVSQKLGALLSGIQMVHEDRQQAQRGTRVSVAGARQRRLTGEITDSAQGPDEQLNGGDVLGDDMVTFLEKLATVLDRADITINVKKDDHEQAG
jgi:hypothetical protein